MPQSPTYQPNRRRSAGSARQPQPAINSLSLPQLRETLAKTERLLSTLPSATAASSSHSAPDPIVQNLLAQRQAMRDREAELMMDQLKLEALDVKGKGRAREVVGDDGTVRGMTRKEGVLAAIDMQEKQKGANGHFLPLEASLALDTRETELSADNASRIRHGASPRHSKPPPVGAMDEISRAQQEARLRAFMSYAASDSDTDDEEGIYIDVDDSDNDYTALNPSQPSHTHQQVDPDEDDMFPEGNDDLDLGAVIQVDVDRALGGGDGGLQVPMES